MDNQQLFSPDQSWHYTRTMELKQLRYLLAIAELKSLTAGAEKLNLTQPALGQQMRKLEADLGTRLIERHSRGVHLTEAGERLKTHAEDIIARVEQAEEDIRRFSATPSGCVRLGITPSLGRVIVPQLLESASDQLPEVSIQFTQGLTDQLDSLIARRELDIAVTHSLIDNDQIETLPLYHETVFLIGHADLIGGLAEPVSLEELARLPIILDEQNQHVRNILDQELSQFGLKLSDYVEIAAINIRRELIMQGRRCVLAPRALFQLEIDAGSIVARRTGIAGLDRLLHLASTRVERLNPAQESIRRLMIRIVDRATQEGMYGWRMP